MPSGVIVITGSGGVRRRQTPRPMNKPNITNGKYPTTILKDHGGNGSKTTVIGSAVISAPQTTPAASWTRERLITNVRDVSAVMLSTPSEPKNTCFLAIDGACR